MLDGLCQLWKRAFGLEGLCLLDIKDVLVFLVFLVEVIKVGLGPEGSGVVSHFNEIYNKVNFIIVLKTALFLSLNLFIFISTLIIIFSRLFSH